MATYHKEYYEANRQRIIEHQMKYYGSNKEKCIAYMQGYNGLYYELNKERINEQRKALRDARKMAKPPKVRKTRAVPKKKVNETSTVLAPLASFSLEFN